MTAYELPARAVVPLAAFLINKPLSPEYPAGGDVIVVARELLDEPVRIAVAAELRQQADYYHEEAMRERKRSLRLANRAPKWQHEVAIASFQELAAVAKRLRIRADYLHPEGAES